MGQLHSNTPIYSHILQRKVTEKLTTPHPVWREVDRLTQVTR